MLRRLDSADWCEAILTTQQECDRLTPGAAQEVFGKLSFCLQPLFGRVGRASALPLVQRFNDHRYLLLGLVLHDLEDPIIGRLYAADVCPAWLMEKFLEHGQSSICSLELLAALCLLLTFKERLRGRRVYFFVDVTPAWSCMINGFSRSKPMAEMGNLFRLAIAALEIDRWVEWVNRIEPSEHNERVIPQGEERLCRLHALSGRNSQ